MNRTLSLLLLALLLASSVVHHAAAQSRTERIGGGYFRDAVEVLKERQPRLPWINAAGDPFAEPAGRPRLGAEESFRVSRVGGLAARESREKLIEIHEALAMARSPARPGEAPRSQSFRVRAVLGPRLFVVGHPTDWSGQDVALQTSEPQPEWAEGTLITVTSRQSGTHTYQTTAGMRTLARLIEAKAPEAEALFPRADFLADLRAGKTFTAQLVERRRCPACNGHGSYRGDAQRGENPDQLIPCALGQDGQALFLVTYRVSWE